MAFLIGAFKLYAQNPNHIDDELPPPSYKPGKIITLKDTINCYILDRENRYYCFGKVKYKMSHQTNKTFQIKSEDIMHLEIENHATFDRFAYGAKSYLMAKVVDGEVKLYQTVTDGFNNGFSPEEDFNSLNTINSSYTPNSLETNIYFLNRGNMIYSTSQLNKSLITKIFPDNPEFVKEIENMTRYRFLKNIEQLVQRYNSSANQSTNESK